MQQVMRQLRLNEDDVAAFFKVEPKTVRRWLKGPTPVPFPVQLSFRGYTIRPKANFDPVENIITNPTIQNGSEVENSMVENKFEYIKDNSIGLNTPLITEDDIRTVLRNHAIGTEHIDNGITHTAVLFPGGAAIIETPNDGGTSEAMISDILDNAEFVDHMNALIDLQGKINERPHGAGQVSEIPIICENLTFVLNLFGRKRQKDGRYYFTEIVTSMVATRAYKGSLVQKSAEKLVQDLRELVKEKCGNQ